MPKKTKFAEESKSTAVAVRGPSEAMLKLFAPKTEAESGSILDTMQRKNMPRLVKAVDRNGVNIPVGGIVAGIIVDVIASPKSDIKGSLLWLHIVEFDGKKNPQKTGVEICFPATGSIRQALAPNAKGKDEEKEQSARELMLAYKGHLIICKRQDDGFNRNYNKEMTLWDVYVSDEPVDIGVKIH